MRVSIFDSETGLYNSAPAKPRVRAERLTIMRESKRIWVWNSKKHPQYVDDVLLIVRDDDHCQIVEGHEGVYVTYNPEPPEYRCPVCRRINVEKYCACQYAFDDCPTCHGEGASCPTCEGMGIVKSTEQLKLGCQAGRRVN